MTDGELVLSAIAFGTSAWAIGATVAAGLMMRGQAALIAPLRKELRSLIARIDEVLAAAPATRSGSASDVISKPGLSLRFRSKSQQQ